MKRVFLSVIVLCILAASSFVQAQGIGVGIKAGVNFANQSVDSDSGLPGYVSPKGRTGFHGGAYVIFGLSEKWAILPELMYSSVGSIISELEQEIKCDYLSIPVLLRWKPISWLSVEAGPQLSVLLDVKDIDEDVIGINETSIKDNFRGADFGLALGATAHLPFGINAGARYVWGIANVSDKATDTVVKNNVAQIFVGWTIFGAK